MPANIIYHQICDIVCGNVIALFNFSQREQAIESYTELVLALMLIKIGCQN